MTRQRERKAKDIDQEAPLQRDNSAERQYARKRRKSPSGEEDRPPCFSSKKKRIVVMIKSVIIGIPRIANTSKKKNKCQMGQDCRFIHSQKKNRSTSPKRKGTGKKSEKRGYRLQQ